MAFLDKTGLERLWAHITAKFVSREEYENTSMENLTGVLPVGNGGTNSDTVEGAQANMLVSTMIDPTTNINEKYHPCHYHSEGNFAKENGWPEDLNDATAELIVYGYVTGVGSGLNMGVNLENTSIVQRVVFHSPYMREYVRTWDGNVGFSDWKIWNSAVDIVYSESEPEHVEGQIWLQPIS